MTRKGFPRPSVARDQQNADEHDDGAQREGGKEYRLAPRKIDEEGKEHVQAQPRFQLVCGDLPEQDRARVKFREFEQGQPRDRRAAAPWRADDAARRLGVSCGYFHALYKKYFDTTFLSDVVRARVQAAEELLVSSADSVERIAERCGYNNTEHFIRQFRARTGTTPTGYRKSR